MTAHTTFRLITTGVEVLAAGKDWPLTYTNRSQAERKAKSVGGTVYQSPYARRCFYVRPAEPVTA
jgi:hypothetical protein